MTQDQAYNEFIPYINDTGKIYRKISPIYARIAVENEYIETWTEDGLETTNYAKIGDYVVQNLYTSNKQISVSVQGQKPSNKTYSQVLNSISGYIQQFSKPNGFVIQDDISSGESTISVSKTFFFK